MGYRIIGLWVDFPAARQPKDIFLGGPRPQIRSISPYETLNDRPHESKIVVENAVASLGRELPENSVWRDERENKHARPARNEPYISVRHAGWIYEFA